MRTHFSKHALIAAAVFTTAITSSCGNLGSNDSLMSPSSVSAAASASTVKLNGSGATFPEPLYAQWADAYKATKGVELNYAAIGSGGGIKQIQSRTVDFGASDDPIKIDDLEKNGLVQLPATVGGVVLAYNLPGRGGEIKLDGATVADIFLGKVTKWTDARIAQINAGTKLPTSRLRRFTAPIARARPIFSPRTCRK